MFKIFSKNKKTKEPIVEEKQPVSIKDIKDDDMMAAVLVATIDYATEVKQDVRLVSIRQIG